MRRAYYYEVGRSHSQQHLEEELLNECFSSFISSLRTRFNRDPNPVRVRVKSPPVRKNRLYTPPKKVPFAPPLVMRNNITITAIAVVVPKGVAPRTKRPAWAPPPSPVGRRVDVKKVWLKKKGLGTARVVKRIFVQGKVRRLARKCRQDAGGKC